MALLSRLSMIWRSRRSLPISRVCCTSLRCRSWKMSLSIIWAETSDSASSASARRSNSSCSSTACPELSLFMSSTSLTRSSRWFAESWILLRHCRVLAASPSLAPMISSMPKIPLMGVRKSWLMRFMNSVFALLSESAVCNACSRRRFSACSCSWNAEVFLISTMPRTMGTSS